MLTDIICLSIAFAGGWLAHRHFGSYAEMRDWVKAKVSEIKGS